MHGVPSCLKFQGLILQHLDLRLQLRVLIQSQLFRSTKQDMEFRQRLSHPPLLPRQSLGRHHHQQLNFQSHLPHPCL